MIEARTNDVLPDDGIKRIEFNNDHFKSVLCSPGHDWHWSFKQFGDPKNHTFNRKIITELRKLKARRLFAPNVIAMNGKVVAPEKLEKIVLSKTISLFRNPSIPADITYLNLPTDAFGMSNAGCALAALTGMNERGEDIRIFAHVALKSILNGVIDSMAHQAVKMGARLDRLFFTLLFEIHPDELVYDSHDPKWGSGNCALLKTIRDDFGPEAIIPHSVDGRECIDLAMLARLRAVRYFGHVVTGIERLQKGGPYAYVTHPDERLRGLVRNVTFAMPIF